MDGTVLAPRPVSAPTHVVRAIKGFRRRHILLSISIFVLLLVAGTGLLAPWISPHNPTKGNLADEKLPPFWASERTIEKTVVDFPESGKGHVQISVSKAQRIDPNIQIGDQITEVIRGGGSTKYLLGTDHMGRDVMSRIIHGARISLIIAAITLG
ncbi:MAG: hypothetical protein ACE5Q6_03040, partial [Dehalococcoidia bacterium]